MFTLLMDFSLGKIYDFLYFTEKSKKHDRLIHSAIGTHEDVLIFGSSRAYHHYNPEIFEKELGLSCFNAGYGGQNIYYHLALLKSALKRHKPKVVVLDLFYIDYQITKEEHDKEKLGVLLPFVHKSDVMKQAVLMRGFNENIKLLSSIYPFNSKQLYMVRNNISNNRPDFKGFVGLHRNWNQKITYQDFPEYEIDSFKLKAIFEFIQLCKDNNSEIFINVSPHFAKVKDKSIYLDLEEMLKTKYGLQIHNYENDSILLSNKYFSDPFHLNIEGANLFSKIVANNIKQSQIQ
jgi:hypothetical protein